MAENHDGRDGGGEGGGEGPADGGSERGAAPPPAAPAAETARAAGARPRRNMGATPAAVPARLTVVESLYHQRAGDHSPVNVVSSFARLLPTDEQAYVRVLTVTAEWAPLDAGWIKGDAMLSVVNEEGKFRMVNPTPEEREAAAARVVELSFSGTGGGDDPPAPAADVILPPGESLRVQPSRLSSVRLRCRRPEGAKCTVILFPLS